MSPENQLTTQVPRDESDTPLVGGQWARDVSMPASVLCSPAAVGAATFLCGPMAGVLLLARNDSLLKKRGGGMFIFLFGALVCVVEGAVLSLITMGRPMMTGPGLFVTVLNLVILIVIGSVLHGKAVRAQHGAGPTVSPVRAVIGLALLGLVLSLVFLLGAGSAIEALVGDTEITIAPNKQVRYARNVTVAEAQALGQFLMNENVFGGPTEQTARLDRDGNVYTVSFWLDSTPDAEDQEYYRWLCQAFAEHVFWKAEVRVRLLDLYGKERMVLTTDP